MRISLITNNWEDVVVNKKNMFIWIPNCFVLNSTALKIAKKQPGGQHIPDIPKEFLPKLRKAIRQVKKIHKNWVLVDVESADGEKVQVKL